MHWIGVRTLAEALDRIRAAATRAPKGAWLIVAGGWTERQFKEDRRPTQAEIVAAAPDHHVYIQQLYSRVLLDPGGADALGIAGNRTSPRASPSSATATAQPTGWLTGDNRAISDLFDLLPRPTFAQKVEGTRAFFRALNAVGITGVIDPGGYNLVDPRLSAAVPGLARARADAPRALQPVARRAAATSSRTSRSSRRCCRWASATTGCASTASARTSPGACTTTTRRPRRRRTQLVAVLRWAVSRGMTATFHWHNDRAVHHLLDVLERVNAETPVASLRWSIAHLNDASPESLKRMKAMGLGWLMQNAFYFRGEAFLGQRGADVARLVAADRQRAAAWAFRSAAAPTRTG